MNIFTELTKTELALFKELDTPYKMQEYLDTLKYRNESGYFSPRQAIEDHQCHCFDGSLLCMALLTYHNYKPLLLKLIPSDRDDSHMLAVFKQGKFFGAIGKSNYPDLTFREPIYPSLRELAMSYFHSYYNSLGEKTLRGYTELIDLTPFAKLNWVTDGSQLQVIANQFKTCQKFKLLTSTQIKNLNPLTTKGYEMGMQGVDLNGVMKLDE